MAAIASKYYVSTKNKRLVNQAKVPTKTKGFDDDVGYSGPSILYGNVRETDNINIKSAIDDIGWDMDETGVNIIWKHHQCAESSTQIIIFIGPCRLCWSDTEFQIRYYLKKIEKKLCDKGKLISDLFDKDLPALTKLTIHWAHHKKGKSQNKAETRLSLSSMK